jgi:hypothetical protein
LLEKNDKGKELRRWLIGLGNQHDTGLAFSAIQIESLIDLSKAMTLISIQKDVERKHFDLFNNKYEWHNYRASLLGFDTNDLIEAMRKVNKKHKSMRASLIVLDSPELIRIGIIDLMIAMGKTIEYAANVGNLCKSMANRMEFGNIIWDDTKKNPLGLNQSSVDERKNMYSSATQKLIS